MDLTNHQLSLTNKSGKDISILYSNHNAQRLTENNVAYYIADWNIMKSDSSKDIVKAGNKNAWHEYIEQGRTKKLFVYIFETDTLKKYSNIYSMDDIVREHKYLKLLSYSENDLNKIGWKIIFD
jgi:hypothetical protein